MRQTFLTFISLFIFSSLFGQVKFDYHKDFNKISELSQDSLSVYYYQDQKDDDRT